MWMLAPCICTRLWIYINVFYPQWFSFHCMQNGYVYTLEITNWNTRSWNFHRSSKKNKYFWRFCITAWRNRTQIDGVFSSIEFRLCVRFTSLRDVSDIITLKMRMFDFRFLCYIYGDNFAKSLWWLGSFVHTYTHTHIIMSINTHIHSVLDIQIHDKNLSQTIRLSHILFCWVFAFGRFLIPYRSLLFIK